MELRVDFKNFIKNYTPEEEVQPIWDLIKNSNKLDELEKLLEETYVDGMNEEEFVDLLRFDKDWVLNNLGIEEKPVEEECEFFDDEIRGWFGRNR